ncbi:hypothetical protein RUND412_007070 [Rhizina undulata]
MPQTPISEISYSSTSQTSAPSTPVSSSPRPAESASFYSTVKSKFPSRLVDIVRLRTDIALNETNPTSALHCAVNLLFEDIDLLNAFGSFIPDFHHAKVHEFPGRKEYRVIETFLQNTLTFYVLGFDEKPRLERRVNVAPGTKGVTREWLERTIPALFNPAFGGVEAEGMESKGMGAGIYRVNNFSFSFGIKDIPAAQGPPELQSWKSATKGWGPFVFGAQETAGIPFGFEFGKSFNEGKVESPYASPPISEPYLATEKTNANTVAAPCPQAPIIEGIPEAEKEIDSENEPKAGIIQMYVSEEPAASLPKPNEFPGEPVEAEESTNYDAIPDAINCPSDIQKPMVRDDYTLRLLSLARKTVQMIIQILGIISLFINCTFGLPSYFGVADNSITVSLGFKHNVPVIEAYHWANLKPLLPDTISIKEAPPILSTGPESQPSQDPPVPRYTGDKQIALRPHFPISVIFTAENSETENASYQSTMRELKSGENEDGVKGRVRGRIGKAGGAAVLIFATSIFVRGQRNIRRQR